MSTDRPPGGPSFFRTSGSLVVPLVVLTALGSTGNLLAPTLVEEAPLLLAMLNPRAPFLLAAAPSTAPVPFFLLALARLVAADPSHYLLGRRHGPAVLSWMSSRGRHQASLVRFVTRHFRRNGAVIVFLFPKGNVLLVAGAHDAPARSVVLADCTGTAARLLGLYLAGHAFAGIVTTAAPIVSVAVLVATLAGGCLSLIGRYRDAVRACRTTRARLRRALRRSRPTVRSGRG